MSPRLTSPLCWGEGPLSRGSDRLAEMEALAGRLGWQVSDDRWLTRSLAHRSWGAETPGGDSNERLEFLGDAVLGLVVTDHLFRTYPTLPEGELAKVRASVVNSATLADIAASLDVGDALLLGKGEGRSGGREKPSILADAMEALIGAVYLDQGWAAVERAGHAAARGSHRAGGGRSWRSGLQDQAPGALRPPLRRAPRTTSSPTRARITPSSFDASVRVAGQVWGDRAGPFQEAGRAGGRPGGVGGDHGHHPGRRGRRGRRGRPVEPNDDEPDGAVPAPSGDGDGDTAPTGAESAGLATPDAASAPAVGRA